MAISMEKYATSPVCGTFTYAKGFDDDGCMICLNASRLPALTIWQPLFLHEQHGSPRGRFLSSLPGGFPDSSKESSQSFATFALRLNKREVNGRCMALQAAPAAN